MRTLLYPLLALGLFGADWPQFRGPNGSGLCPSCGQLPTRFGPQENVLWKTPLPPGKSSPVLSGDRIFLTASEGDDLITMCLSRTTGKVQWRRSVRAARREAQNTLNDRAGPTAVTDGKSVFVFFADFGLVAYDFEGKQRWQLPLGPFNSQHGLVASPVWAEGRVILVCDQDTDAYMIGVDADSGKVAWKTPRNVINGYSTPTIYRPARGPVQVIAPGSYQLTAYSIVDGEPLWFVRGLTCQPKSAPIIAGDIVYFNGWTTGNDPGQQVELPTFAEAIAAADANHDGKLSQKELPPAWQPTGTWRAIDLDRDGFLNEREWTFFRTRRASRNGLLAVKLGGSGDVTDTHVLWRFEKSLPDVPSPLVYENVVFLVKSGGIATTLDAQTGKVLKQARLTGALEDYYASPIGVEGKVYIASEHGKVVVLRAAGDWEILAINDFDSDIYATPAISDGKMYIRTRDALYAIAKKTDNRGASEILEPGKGWNLLGEGYQLTADSTVDHEGNVYLTDARKNRILKIDLEGKVSTWKEGSNGSHGIACGPDGRLYAGQHDRKRIVAFSSAGTESVVAEGIQTHHLTVTSRNDIYFTVPPAHQVWLVDAAGRKRVVHEGLNWPRGVRASPDQSRLLVADPPKNQIWSFQIGNDGSLSEGRPTYHLETSDGTSEADVGGMAFDSEGFLYVATKFGVQVFGRQGGVAAIIDAPGSEGVNNVLFAGPGLQWLYVMDGERVYRRSVRRRGVAAFQ